MPVTSAEVTYDSDSVYNRGDNKKDYTNIRSRIKKNGQKDEIK